eukprot:gene23541-4710_t
MAMLLVAFTSTLPLAAGHSPLTLPSPSEALPPTLRRLGAMDYEPGESSPVTFNGRPHMLESISGCYPGNARFSLPEWRYCPSYLRVIDLTDGSVVTNITGSCNHTFGSAIASSTTPETMHVFSSRWSWCPTPHGAPAWGGSCGEGNGSACIIDVFSSTDKTLQ